MLTLRVYQRADGSSPFGSWLDALDDAAHARVTQWADYKRRKGKEED
jgi:hypothetical protein